MPTATSEDRRRPGMGIVTSGSLKVLPGRTTSWPIFSMPLPPNITSFSGQSLPPRYTSQVYLSITCECRYYIPSRDKVYICAHLVAALQSLLCLFFLRKALNRSTRSSDVKAASTAVMHSGQYSSSESSETNQMFSLINPQRNRGIVSSMPRS